MTSRPNRASLCAATRRLPLAASAAPDAAALRAIVDTIIQPLMAEHDVPGMAVAVTVDGRTAVFNYGFAAREAQTPVGDTTLFEVGSISKTITATLGAYAVVQGKLSLDDHPGKYLPELQGSAIDKATVLHLGTFTAGGLPLRFPDDVSDPLPMRFYRDWKPVATPGNVREYSDPSLGLFGLVIARAMGMGFAEAVQTRLLPELGMRDSYIDVPASAMARYAWGEADGRPKRMDAGPLAPPTYGLRSTAADLMRFVQVNMAPLQSNPTLRRAVDATHVGYFKIGRMTQGLGWEQYAWPVSLNTLLDGNSRSMNWEPHPAQRLQPAQAPTTPTLFNKTGSTGGFGAYVAFVPAQKIGIVMLANKNYPIPARVTAAYAILQALASQDAPQN